MEQLNHTQSHNAVDVQQDSSDIEKTEKIFAAMRILDDELDIKTANEMIWYCTTLEEHFVDTIQHNHEAEFRFAERAIENFEIYNRKNITAVKDEKLRLDVFYATFQLMVTQSKLQLKKITIDEVDFQLMKDQFLMIFNCGFAELFLHYMERVTEDLVYTFMELNYMKSARVILSLYTHVLECIHKMEGEYTEQQSFQNKIAILHAEVQYFGLFFFESSQMMQSDSCWTEEKEQNEGIFVDLLKTLEIKDNYKDIPGVIQTFKQAEKFCKMYFAKMDEYEKYLPIVIEMNKSNTHNHNSAMRGRAQAYFVMAEFQKDGYIKAELCEKSLKLFNKVLKEDFTNEKVQQYFQNDVKCCVFLYGSIVNQNSENYKTVIGVKVENIMNMPPDSKETKLLIKELNSMRRDYAVQLLGFEKFAENNLPELYSPDRMMKLYFDIATQFRSIILNNEKNHQHNLARSYSILMLLADASKSVAELREVWIEANVEDNDYVQGFVDELVREIDQHPFIKRFRKDFTTMP